MSKRKIPIPRPSIINSPDFYSVSGIKDLLFNEYEELFSVERLINFIQDTGLKFIGFENTNLTTLFKKDFGIENLLNLEQWEIFEKKYPRAFSQMYEFWLQKI